MFMVLPVEIEAGPVAFEVVLLLQLKTSLGVDFDGSVAVYDEGHEVAVEVDGSGPDEVAGHLKKKL